MNKVRFTKFALSKLANALESRGLKIAVSENKVSIEGDPLNVMLGKEVLTAFNRGFSDSDSQLLFDQEYILEVMSIENYSKNKRRVSNLKGRVIGRNGSVKIRIEKLTNTKISIFGKTVSIIGRYDDVDKARRIIDTILRGKPFSVAFRSLHYG
ncbi:MAG: KH domain-containing protein [Conexivisphaerales archaeon]